MWYTKVFVVLTIRFLQCRPTQTSNFVLLVGVVVYLCSDCDRGKGPIKSCFDTFKTAIIIEISWPWRVLELFLKWHIGSYSLYAYFVVCSKQLNEKHCQNKLCLNFQFYVSSAINIHISTVRLLKHCIIAWHELLRKLNIL